MGSETFEIRKHQPFKWLTSGVTLETLRHTNHHPFLPCRAEVLRKREKYEVKNSGGFTRIYPTNDPALQVGLGAWLLL